MEQHPLKLGDDVAVTSGPHSGREGYIIGITSHDSQSTPDSVIVRLMGQPKIDVPLTSIDLRRL
jgi:ribosomal protein L24